MLQEFNKLLNFYHIHFRKRNSFKYIIMMIITNNKQGS